MKLLPQKKDIDSAKAQERKQEIDSGLSLAKSVDKLREQLALEKKNLFEWRTANIASVQQEIDSYIETKEKFRIEIEKQEEYRKKLIEPLDKEWAEINRVKVELGNKSNEIFIANEQLKILEKEIENEKKKVSEIVSRVTQNEKDTIKAKEESVSLRDMAQHEYEIAKGERNQQTETFEKSLSDLAQQKKEYEVALSIIQIRENEVKEKESDIIKREQHLEMQQRTLRVAKEALKL